jgi:hypothetical protein
LRRCDNLGDRAVKFRAVDRADATSFLLGGEILQPVRFSRFRERKAVHHAATF